MQSFRRTRGPFLLSSTHAPINMPPYEEPMVVESEEEPKGITITIRQNGCRKVSSAFEEALCQRRSHNGVPHDQFVNKELGGPISALNGSHSPLEVSHLPSESPGTPHKHKIDRSDKTSSALTETSSVPVRTTTEACCRLPFNGHAEDEKHYRVCPIVLHGAILREEYTSWLNTIDLHHSCVPQIVNFVIGSSCKQIMLTSKCSEEHCPYNHTITDVNLKLPPKYINAAFDVFTKWFLENAHHPDFRAILLVISRLPKDHNNVIMIVLSFATMVLKLPHKMYRKALCIRLVQVMVNMLELKPWEAVQTLIVFFITPETKMFEILNLLSSLELTSETNTNKSAKKQEPTNHLYQSVSCLWHLNEAFVCPPDLIFKVLEECLAQMPEDLKLTKDRIVMDLMTLRRPVLRQRYNLIDKFFSKYYPMNSEIVRVFKSSALYGKDVSKSSQYDGRPYESCRVKSTGPVNPKWDHWNVQEARAKALEAVLKNTMKAKQRQEVTSTFRPMPNISLGAEIGEEPSSDECKYFLGNRSYKNPLRTVDVDAELDCLVEFLHSEKCEEVAKIISSYDDVAKKDSLERCMKTLQREFENCNRAEIPRVFSKIFLSVPGSLSDENSSKSAFACMCSSLVVHFYKDADYSTALKLIKCMGRVGVNHLEHVTRDVGKNVYIVVCSDIFFRTRLYTKALRMLKYGNCLTILSHPFDGRLTDEYFVLEGVVKNMFRLFLKERLAAHAMWIFRAIFSAQRDLRYPFDIGKFYEGTVFLSFIRNLKNPCPVGDGADLYITVDRVCGNSERFHSITYRSLLVELHRVNSPEDVIRRTLWICLQRKIYPDFSKGTISPLVLESHLSKDEISIYLEHYFTYFIVQNDVKRLTDRPFIVGFTETPPPDVKLFSVSNDIMKTPRTIPEALGRLKRVLEELHPNLQAEFDQDRVTIPVQGIEELLTVFSR